MNYIAPTIILFIYLRCLTPPPNHSDSEYSPLILVLSRTINVPSCGTLRILMGLKISAH